MGLKAAGRIVQRAACRIVRMAIEVDGPFCLPIDLLQRLEHRMDRIELGQRAGIDQMTGIHCCSRLFQVGWIITVGEKVESLPPAGLALKQFLQERAGSQYMVRLFQYRLFHPPVHPSGQRRRIQTVVVVDICPRVSEVGDPLNSEALFERRTDQMGGMRRSGGDQHIGCRSRTDGLCLFQGVAVPAFSGIGQKEISTDPLGRTLSQTRT